MKLSLLRSIGEKREKDFQKLGVYDAESLVRFYPRAYLDLTERSSLKTAYHNDVVLIACEVVRLAPVNYSSRQKIVKAYCSQDGYPFTAVWFNQPYVAQKSEFSENAFSPSPIQSPPLRARRQQCREARPQNEPSLHQSPAGPS